MTRRSPQRKKPLPTPDVEPHPLEATLGYRFQDRGLLELALMHRSVAYEARGGGDSKEKNQPGTDNEQLEFLGDAVLGLVVTELLFLKFPDRSEGEMTRLRAALVSRKRMAELGHALHLGDHLVVGKSAERSGARERPGLIANASEAVLAAMYLDALRSGSDGLAAIRDLLRTHVLEPDLPEIERALEATEGRGALRDAKTLLQERAQAHNAGAVRYIDIDQTGPPHDRRFFVEVRLENGGEQKTLATGEGTSKREAQHLAASRALEAWKPGAAGAAS